MLRTYLKIAFRNFVKEKFFSAINVAGLAVGIAVALLISLYVVHELTFDNFHTKADRVYRIATYLEVGGSGSDINGTFPPLAQAMAADIPEVEEAVRVNIFNGQIFKVDDKVFTEDKILYADAGLFDLFDFHLLSGDPATSLAKRYQILLTPALVQKYFPGNDFSGVVGKTILVNQELYQVTGVIESAPSNSHIQYQAIASMESIPQGRDKGWNNINLTTYILLRPGTEMSTVMAKIPVTMKKYLPNIDELAKQGLVMRPIAHALREIHLYSKVRGDFEPGGSIMNIYIFGSIAIIVVLLASVNFVNLLTARSSNRAKEVGVRKVLGSSRRHLMKQFVFECMLLVAISTLIALGVVELLRTPFSLLIGKALPFDLLLSPRSAMLLIGFILILGILSGSYPAFFLSAFRPAEVLKGKIRSGFKNGTLRNSLVALQFVISMVLITCTLIMQRQLDFVRSKNLGFDKEHVLVIDNSDRLKNQQTYIEEIKRLTGVAAVGASTFRPVDDYDGMLITTEEETDERQQVSYSRVDQEYLEVMKYEFVEGRNFSKDLASDSAAVIINEKAAKLLYGGEAVGKKLYNEYGYTVIGVVKDFNFESLKNEVRPLVFYPHGNQRFLHVRLNPGNYEQTIRQLERIWKEQTADIPFYYSFLDDTYNDLYHEEVTLGTIFSIFTALGLFIACLGLMGITAYTAEQRKKEISIRKVLGANFSQVLNLLAKDFSRIMLVAFIAAVPLSWYMMDKWLETFVYRTAIPVALLVAGGVAVVLTAIIAISYQSIRAALVDPIDSLKEE